MRMTKQRAFDLIVGAQAIFLNRGDPREMEVAIDVALRALEKQIKADKKKREKKKKKKNRRAGE